jgi:predicted pyridoxine 5'-phosphate oxidase superfamily flavin-nucleotide-binding protein
VRAKVADHLSDLTRQFVDRSPFVLLATSAPDGTCDVSPRGDPPGFVCVLDKVFMHCAKAFLRAQLWDPGRYVGRRDLPSAGAIHRSLDPSFDAEAYDAARGALCAARELLLGGRDRRSG